MRKTSAIAFRLWAPGCVHLLCAMALSAPAESTDGRFRNHGIAAPVAQRAWGGISAVEDSNGRALLLIPFILPSNALLVVDAETGETQQFNVDYEGSAAYMRYHLLSRDGRRWYTTVGNVFREFDIDRREWTFVEKGPDGRGSLRGHRGMFEDEEGRIWVAFSPDSHVFSFDPDSRAWVNHGTLAEEPWVQYPRIALDDTGWLYATIRIARGNLVAMHTRTGERRQLVDEQNRQYAAGQHIFRAANGRVYARLSPPGQWYELYAGAATPVEEPPFDQSATWYAGWKDPALFPDGRRVIDYSVPSKYAVIEDPESGRRTRIQFDYEVEGGANIYAITEGFEGDIYGSTGTPVIFFRFDPAHGTIRQLGGLADYGGHINAKTVQGGRLYGALYSSGSLIEYDPARPWHDAGIRESTNPRELHGHGEAVSLYGRPYVMLTHPDGRHVVMAGNPRRSLAGGGMLIYDTETAAEQVIRPENLVPDQGPMCLAALSDGSLVGGTTTAPGTAGTRVAEEAELFIFDWETRQVVFRTVPVPGALQVIDLEVTRNGMVLGFTRGGRDSFFVFDPRLRRMVHLESTARYGLGEPAGGQAPRMMTTAPDGFVYALFRQGIVRLDPERFTLTDLARTPVTVGAGIVLQDGRLYFTDRVGGRGGPALWSYELPPSDWHPPVRDIAEAHLLFREPFDSYPLGPIAPATSSIGPWSVRHLPESPGPDKRIEIVRDSDDRFGHGVDNRHVRFRDLTTGILGLLLRDHLDGASVLTVAFDLYEPDEGAAGTVGVRVGRAGVSGPDIGNIASFGNGRTSGNGRYALESSERIEIVFNNSDTRIRYNAGRDTLREGCFDIWCNGEKVATNHTGIHRYLGPLTSVQLFKHSGKNACDVLIDNMVIFAGARTGVAR